MVLVDANLLLYAVNGKSAPPFDRAEVADTALNGTTTVGFSWMVLLAFVRLATHPGVFDRPLAPGEALDLVRSWLAQPTAIVVEPTARHLEVVGQLLSTAGSAGNLVNDAHLAALAIEHDADLVSFDADFSRFAGVRWQRPGTA